METNTRESREKLKPGEVTALETLCELTRFNARVTGQEWRRRALDFYGEKSFWLDSLAERGLIELAPFEFGYGDNKYLQFGWRPTEFGKRVLVANGGRTDIKHNAWPKRPLHVGRSSSQHRF